MSQNTSTVTSLVSQGSRLGPLFYIKDQCAIVKVSNEDKKRAVINLTSRTLVDYVDATECPKEVLHSDQSLFVPIFCKECYGTNEADYREALTGIVSCGRKKFLVGVCSVFGKAQDEVYPDSRKEFVVDNEYSYSGACHPQPGKAVFLHKVKGDIGNVMCYWHVHSRSVEKTFLYCCVACNENEYTKHVLDPNVFSMGFSLGTVGDNTSGPVTEECSLVPVPMRPGCFCTLVNGGNELAQVMTRMGFSTLKDRVLEAGVEAVDVDDSREKHTEVEVSSDQKHSATVNRNAITDESTVVDTVQLLRTAVLDQAAEVQVLKDILEGIKVQNNVLIMRLNQPHDPDTLFTVQGARDFTTRTGFKTKLCAGVPQQGIDTETINVQVTDTAQRSERKTVDCETTMTAVQTQIDTLIRLLQQQQQQQQPEAQQQQPHQLLQQTAALHQPSQTLQHLTLPPLHQQQQLYQHMQPQGLWNVPRIPQTFMDFEQPQALWHPSHHLGQGLSGDRYLYNFPSSSMKHNGQLSHYGQPLSDEQKKRIAMEYNKNEAERCAASQKEQEQMIDSIKASIRDVLLEKHQQQQQQQQQSSTKEALDMGMLKSLASGIPYKRTPNKQTNGDQTSADISQLMIELRDLTNAISSKRGGGDDGVREKSKQVPPTIDNQQRAETYSNSGALDSPQSQFTQQQSNSDVSNKLQAGYSVPPVNCDLRDTQMKSVTDFISAVVTKN